MITSFPEYVEGVLESESADQIGWRKDIPPKIYRGLHALVGFATEIGELVEAIIDEDTPVDWPNIREEGGDAWWYAGVLADVLGLADVIRIPLDQPCDMTDAQRVARLKELALRYTMVQGRAFDVIKRRIWYFAEELEDGNPKKAKALWVHAETALAEICVIIAHICTTAGYTVEDVWTTNLRKLIGPTGRYAGKFDPHKALHRNLVAEREVLEEGVERGSGS